MNGTLWNPAASPWPELRATALLLLCLAAAPALGADAPPVDASPTSAPAAEAVAAPPAVAAPTASASAAPIADASGKEAAKPVKDPAAVVAPGATPPAPAVVAASPQADGPGTVAGATADADPEPVAAVEAASPGSDGVPEEDPAAAPELADVPAWRPEGLEGEDEDLGASAGGMLLRTVLVLGVVLAAIYLTLNVGLRRLMGLSAVGGRGNGALLQVVERHAVGPRHALLVIRAGDDHLVVSQSEGQMNLISRIEPSQVEARAAAKAEAPAATPVLSPFLQKLLARRGEAVQSPDPAPPPPSTPPTV